MEQELASIFKFVLDAADNPTPYYHNIPQDFVVPSAYFPVPEIATSGETFLTYAAEYDWYIKFFHSSDQDAYAMALKALTALKESRNLVPLLSISGEVLNEFVRIKDPELRMIADNTAQLSIRFVSRRPYSQPERHPSTGYIANVEIKPDPRERERVRYDTEFVRNVPVGISDQKSDIGYEHDLCGVEYSGDDKEVIS